MYNLYNEQLVYNRVLRTVKKCKILNIDKTYVIYRFTTSVGFAIKLDTTIKLTRVSGSLLFCKIDL